MSDPYSAYSDTVKNLLNSLRGITTQLEQHFKDLHGDPGSQQETPSTKDIGLIKYAEVKKLLELSEINRREPASSSLASPLPTSEQHKVCEVLGMEPTLVDYAEFTNMIDRAVHHLDEGLPCGQEKRVAAAILVLEFAAVALKTWCMTKGYRLGQVQDEASKLS